MSELARRSRLTGIAVLVAVVVGAVLTITEVATMRWVWAFERIQVGDWIEDRIAQLQRTLSGPLETIREQGAALIGRLEDILDFPLPIIFAIAASVLVIVLRAAKFNRELVDLGGLVRAMPLAIFTFASFRFVEGMDLWDEFVQTFALILIATALAVAVAVPVGIAAANHRAVSMVVRPVLDFMQTLPVFVYLLPAVAFLQIGVVPGLFATLVFAVPPGIRLTELGIRQVDQEVVEAAEAFGSTKRQLLWGVKLPLALPTIMQGVNQIIMLALSMVVVAGMIGAGGLGSVVIRGVSANNIGLAFEGGLAVVILAIFLDRLTSTLRDRMEIPG